MTSRGTKPSYIRFLVRRFTSVRVTNVKPGLVETHFSNVRFHGNDARAEKVYEGVKPLLLVPI